ncbi:MAG: aminopeptidase P family protein [Candidatus Heimdallarchaeota archaeon]|nr:aminopeptidase P family protein [Candidatus Heimdallarchaeota archaeon]
MKFNRKQIDMIEERQKQLIKLMKLNSSECLILVPGVDLFYSTGLITHASERLTTAIIPAEGEPILICPSFEKTRIEKGITTGSIITWEEDQDPFKVLGSTIEELGIEKKQIALDNKLWFEWFLKIKDVLPNASFVDSKAIIQQSRLIKSEQEIAILKEAAEIASKSIIATFEEVEPGMTEKEISGIVSEKLVKTGGQVSFAIAQTGPNSAIPHGGPTERKLQKDEVLLIDAGPVYKGYIGDITVTSVIGEPSEKFKKVYEIVYQANRAAFNISREGTIAEDVDKAARDIITKEGYGKYFTHRLGHGIGIEGHESPYMVNGNKLVLKEGMCHTIEPGIYINGEFGVRIEDDVVVRKDHCEFLYESPRRIWE